MPRGGSRPGAGRKPVLGNGASMVTVHAEDRYWKRIDRSRRHLPKSPTGSVISRAEALRRATVALAEAAAKGEAVASTPRGAHARPFNMPLRAEERAAAEAAAEAAGISLADFIRTAGDRLAKSFGIH